MLSRSGMCIRFALDTVPTQGRVSAGVKCMQVDDDEVLWAGQLGDTEQMVLFSERGSRRNICRVMLSSTDTGRISLPVSLQISTWSLRKGNRLNLPSWNIFSVTSLKAKVVLVYLSMLK